jgi:prepilin-type N-terminal cleavage/methylation domain-containing protein
MTKKLISTGFTVVELMVTLAIAAVLFGYAIPAFDGLMNQRTATARINQLVLAVNYARSEATKLGGVVSIQSMDASDDANEWGVGYCVVAGNPGDCDAPVLQRFDPLNGMTFDALGALDSIGTLSFNSRGLLTGAAAGEIQLCSTDVTEDPGRSLFINLIGRASTSELVCNP